MMKPLVRSALSAVSSGLCRVGAIPLFVLCLFSCGDADPPGDGGNDGADLEILCSTYPMYLFTRRVVGEREGVAVGLILPEELGCPHHYALTTEDMRKLGRADALVVNGLGMEEFLGAPVRRANADLAVIDSSEGAADLIRWAPAEDHADDDDADHDHGEHLRRRFNPHLFASPRMAARLVGSIARQLGGVDPAGAEIYAANAEAYAARLRDLAAAMRRRCADLANRRIVQPYGAFDYLARDLDLTIVAVMQPHGREPSAAEMLELVRTVGEEDVGAIVTEPQYDDRVARALARETGTTLIELDPVATGPSDPPPDHYEATMRENLRRLIGALDGRTP